MSNTITRKLTLVGALAGTTALLRGHQFTEGSIQISGPPGDVDSLGEYLRRCYQAYPDPSAELDAARAAIEGAEDGTDQVHTDEAGTGDGGPGGSDDPAGGDGEGTQEPEDAGNGATDDNANAGEAGAEDADGNGEGPIVAALKALDPLNDEQWNNDGKPKMSAVEAALGRTDVTRAEVTAAAPDFNRETARGNG